MKKTQKELKKIAKNIKLLILDVDGVMTDGSIILDNEGNEFKVFHVRDGHGIKMLAKAGIQVAIISGRQSKVVERRARELGIKEVYQKCYAKTVAFDHITEKYRLDDSEVAFIGDDIVDIPVLRRVGLPIAVNDATDETKEFASMITKNRGGRGAVREVTDFLLRAKGLWGPMTKEYFET
ncbi:MAG TPA: HAD-IIIA family hydrolase [Thermodesulfovibrionales bacterium]|nr:HAD-IIIA family hydrolase [Thermodesulfovibrionales bacterium]